MDDEIILSRFDALEQKLDYNTEKLDCAMEHMDKLFELRIKQIDERLNKKDEESKTFYKKFDSITEFKYEITGALILLGVIVPIFWKW